MTIPEENYFEERLAQSGVARVRATQAAKFGQFEMALKNDRDLILPGSGSSVRPIRPGYGCDFAYQIFIRELQPSGKKWRPWQTGDPLPASTDFTSELSIKTRGNGVESIVAAQFSVYDSDIGDLQKAYTAGGARPHGATQTDPVSNSISLSEQSAPPGNVSEALLGVDVTFTVVPIGTVMPNHPVFYNSYPVPQGNSDGTWSRPLLIIQVVNNSASYNVESIFFNGDNDNFTYGLQFTNQETLGGSVAPGDSRLQNFTLTQPPL